MKRLVILLIGAMMMSSAVAQVVNKDEAALVYYSPKTAVVVDFTYTIEAQERGIYAAYAEALLGAPEVVEETRTTCTLQDTRIGTQTETDYSRPHKVVAEPAFPLLLSINEKGLLVGYNVSPEPKSTSSKKDNRSTDKPQRVPVKKVAPFSEEVLNAATPLAQANAVAQQILRLRETRTYLLNGEVEHAPADGEAMKEVLSELDKQERQLTELFIGKKTKRTEHKRVRMYPEQKELLLFFSEENGFTDAENIDADTIIVQAKLQPQSLCAAEKKKKAPKLSQLVYNLPGNATIEVLHKDAVLATRTVPVAQLGVDVPLAQDLFTGNELPKIVFSEKTGNIVSISK